MLSISFETSCDETSVAVLDDDKVLSNIISSQSLHNVYGGVIPELASREHLKNISFITDKAIKKAGIKLQQIKLVGATSEPGLIGALFIGLNYAKSIAYSLNSCFIPVNHLHAHIYSTFLNEKKPNFPFIALIISGGHTLLIQVEDYFNHKLLGTTIDDAAGEAFDKVAKMLGFEYPGGPIIDKLATTGNEKFHRFPKPKIKDGKYNFSFSGIKTSVLYYLREINYINDKSNELVSDICASFQYAIIEYLIEVVIKAASDRSISNIVVSGGVSSNSYLRKKFRNLETRGYQIYYPTKIYSTDNAAMVGITAYYKYRYNLGKPKDLEKLFNATARPKSVFSEI